MFEVFGVTNTPPPSVGTIISLVIFTFVWLVLLTRIRAFWQFEPPPRSSVSLADFESPVQNAIRREIPAALITGGCFVAVGWLSVLTHGSNSIWVAIPGLILGLVAVVGIVVTTSIWLVNRPRAFVPPKLRRAPGLISRVRD